jgi:molecular chaperone DnaJ
MTDTFYDLLGVGEDASESDIEDAYREKIKETHPDVSDDVDAAEKTKRLNEAKDVLTDESERERYDSVGHASYVSEDGPFADDANDDGSSGPDRSQGDPSHATGSTTGSQGSAHRGRSGRTRNSGSENTGWTSTNREQRRRAQDGFDGFGDDDSRRTDRRKRRAAQNKAAEEAGWANETERGSSSARRQAATVDGDGSGGNSWNEWETNRSYAVHEGATGVTDLQLVDLLPSQQYLPLTSLTFVLYPILVFSSLFPRFPAIVNVVVAMCTLLMVFYLIMVPEVAFTVFGFWSIITPLALLVVPGPVFTVVGVVALLASWLPFGFAVLMVVVVRP